MGEKQTAGEGGSKSLTLGAVGGCQAHARLGHVVSVLLGAALMSVGEGLEKVGAVWIISELGVHALASILNGRGRNNEDVRM